MVLDDGPGGGENHSLVPARIDIETILGPYILLDSIRDSNGTIIDFAYRAVNEAAVNDYQLPREQILNSTLLKLDPLTGDGRLFDRYVRLVQTGEALLLRDFEFADAPPDNMTYYYDISASKVGDGLGVGWWDVTSRYQRDREVAQAEKQTSAILDSLLDPLQVFRPVWEDGRIVDMRLVRVNPAGWRYLRKRREDLEGVNLRARTRGEAIDVLFAWCRHVALTGQSVVLDGIALTLPNGRQRRYDVRAVPVGDAVSVTYRDVTDRVHAAAQIAQAKERYRLVAENASEMVFQSGSNGLVEWVSPSVQWVLGWPPEQVVGRKFSEFIHPADIEETLNVRKAIMATRAGEGRVEVRMVNSDGAFRWMSILGKAIFDDNGTLIGGVDAVRDIQASKDAQAALLESQERFRRSMDDSAIGMAIVSPLGQYQRVNPAMSAILGRTREQLMSCSWQDLTYPDDLHKDQVLANEILAGKRDTYRLNKRYLKPDGEVVWADLAVSCVRDDNRKVLYYLSQIIDITDSVLAREALANSEEHYRLIAENSLDVVFRASPGGRLLWISPSVTEVLGWQPDEVLGKSMVEYIWPEDVGPGVIDPSRPDKVELEGRVRQADGTFRWIDIISRPVLDETGHVVGRVGRLRDIAAKKTAEDALRRSEQRFRTAMESAPTGMAVVSLDRGFVEVNPALCRLLGRSETWLIGHALGDVLDPVDDALDHRLREDLLRGGAQSLTGDHQMIHADGRRLLVEQSVGLLRDPEGRPSGFVSQFADVTEARQARDQLRFLATHDSLTELLNRRELVARVSGILCQTPRRGESIGILFIDLDRLKPINDTYGHAVGDEVIITVARRLRDHVRASDIVARFGGDEFVVVLPAVHSPDDVERISEVLHEAVRQPIHHESADIRTSMSVGAVVVEPGSDPNVALRQADEALYSAKRQGRDRTVVYRV